MHPRFGTPARAIATQAVLASVLVALGTFDTIVAYFVFITVVFIAATVASVFVLRRRDPAFHVPGYPWTPVVFLGMVAVLLVLLAVNNPLQALLGVGLVAAALPVYQMIWSPRRAAPDRGANPMTWIRVIPFDEDETLSARAGCAAGAVSDRVRGSRPTRITPTPTASWRRTR